VLVGGPNGKDVYTIVAAADVPDITGIKLEALNDPALPAGGPGRPSNGNFVLSELKVTVAPKADPSKITPLELQNAKADFGQEGYGVSGAIDGNEATGWAIAPQFGKTHTAIFEAKSAAKHEG